MVYYKDSHICANPGLTWAQTNEIIGQKLSECGPIIYNPPPGLNVININKRPNTDMEQPIENVADVVDQIMPDAGHTGCNCGGGHPNNGEPKKDKCKQYTPEEKRDYYEKKCREREAAKEAGYIKLTECKKRYAKRRPAYKKKPYYKRPTYKKKYGGYKKKSYKKCY